MNVLGNFGTFCGLQMFEVWYVLQSEASLKHLKLFTNDRWEVLLLLLFGRRCQQEYAFLTDDLDFLAILCLGTMAMHA